MKFFTKISWASKPQLSQTTHKNIKFIKFFFPSYLLIFILQFIIIYFNSSSSLLLLLFIYFHIFLLTYLLTVLLLFVFLFIRIVVMNTHYSSPQYTFCTSFYPWKIILFSCFPKKMLAIMNEKKSLWINLSEYIYIAST